MDNFPERPEGFSLERQIAESAVLADFLETPDAGPPPVLWVGFSGGVDSTVLLHALRKIASVVAIHIDHGLEPASTEWVCHCAAVSRAFGVGFESRSVAVDPSGNIEQAARAARYGVWKSLLADGDALALAHHADDQAETRVWQLLTGRAPGGMPEQRRLGAGRLVRPLLRVRRQDLLNYANRHRLDWIDDPSNDDLDLDRNFIRQRIMPRLVARHPDAVERLAASRPRPARRLRALPVAQASQSGVQAWLLAAGLPVPARAVAEIDRQNRAPNDRLPRVRVAPGIRAWRHRGEWHLVRDPDTTPTAHIAAVRSGHDLDLPGGILIWRQTRTGLPNGLDLSIRRRRGGERIRPVGRRRTKTVKALFQEAHVPPWQRADWPLLHDAGCLVAVPGLAVASERVRSPGLTPVWTPRESPV